jgi:nicotinamide-nucleotide amidase
MFSEALLARAERLLEACRRTGLRVAVAESCTGGLIAGCLTEIPGSSDVVERGFVTYSNAAKVELLGVPAKLIQDAGAVSTEVAEAMAAGALGRSPADVVVAATGVAGPGGGSAEKPVGLVYLGAARRGAAPTHERHVFAGDRAAVRLASVEAALDLLERTIGRSGP